eukprot:2129495-Pyramimonas_sp.AAC.1
MIVWRLGKGIHLEVTSKGSCAQMALELTHSILILSWRAQAGHAAWPTTSGTCKELSSGQI